jgi:hypothetical protein
MNPKVSKLLSCLLIFIVQNSVAQVAYQFSVPLKAEKRQTYINAYGNAYTNEIIIEQEDKNEIARLLLDTNFAVLKQYLSSNEKLALSKSQNRPTFFKELSTAKSNYELYIKDEKILLIKLDFDLLKDTVLAALKLREQYRDERFLAAFSGKDKISCLAFTKKKNKLLLYTLNEGEAKFVKKEFLLPKNTLSKEDVKQRGKSLAVKYARDLWNLSVSNLQKPIMYNIALWNQLFYTDDKVFISLTSPHNVGFHLLELTMADSSATFTNFNINPVDEKVPTLTVIDSTIVIQNTTNDMLEYSFFNLYSKKLLAYYQESTKKGLTRLVHSPLMQLGTFGSAKEDKEIENDKTFLRRKNKGFSFLKAFKDSKDSIIITFGSFTATAGIEGTLIFAASFALGASADLFVGNTQYFPYVTTYRYKFLHAYSKFSAKSLWPSTNTSVFTALDKIIADKRMESLDDKSTFVFELNKKLNVGIFNKSSGKYEVFVYD